jgi:hypothetical protein
MMLSEMYFFSSKKSMKNEKYKKLTEGFPDAGRGAPM